MHQVNSYYIQEAKEDVVLFCVVVETGTRVSSLSLCLTSA